MRKVFENLDPLENDFVRTLAFGVNHKAKPAGIALVLGVVKSLRRRKDMRRLRLIHAFSRVGKLVTHPFTT